MQPYIQKFPRLITLEDWLAKAHPDAPPLPWTDDHGVEVCSFVILPLAGSGVMAMLCDAHGREIVRSADVVAVEATCLALNPTPMELTFLPVVDRT